MKKYFVLYNPIIQSFKPKVFKTLITVEKYKIMNQNLTYKAFDDQHEVAQFINNLQQQYLNQKANLMINTIKQNSLKKNNTGNQFYPQSQQKGALKKLQDLLSQTTIGQHLTDFNVSLPNYVINQNTIYQGYFDGYSKGSPGKASLGYHINYYQKQIIRNAKSIGKLTTNQAQLKSLIWCLADAYCNNIKKIHIYGDSKVIIQAMKGNFNVKYMRINPLFDAASLLSKKINFIQYHRVHPALNSLADKISKDSLRETEKQNKILKKQVLEVRNDNNNLSVNRITGQQIYKKSQQQQIEEEEEEEENIDDQQL